MAEAKKKITRKKGNKGTMSIVPDDRTATQVLTEHRLIAMSYVERRYCHD